MLRSTATIVLPVAMVIRTFHLWSRLSLSNLRSSVLLSALGIVKETGVVARNSAAEVARAFDPTCLCFTCLKEV